MANIHSTRITLHDLNNITDYQTPVERINRRQQEQIERQLGYLSEQAKQAQEADPGVTALNTFKNILEFGGAAAKLYQAHKGAQAQNSAAQQEQEQVRYRANLREKHGIEATSQDFKDGFFQISRELKKNGVIAEAKVRDNPDIPLTDKEKVINLLRQPGRFEEAQRHMGYYSANNISAALQGFHSRKGNEIFRDRVLSAQNDPIRLRAALGDSVEGVFKELGLPVDTIWANYGDKITRFLDTKEALTAAKIRSIQLQADGEILARNINAASGSDKPGSTAGVLQDNMYSNYNALKGEGFDALGTNKKVAIDQSAWQKVTQKTTLALTKLALADELQMHEVDAMRRGELLLKQNNGNTGNLLLSNDQWNSVINAINTRAAFAVEEQKATIKNVALNTIATLQDPNTPLETKKKLKDDALSQIQRTLGADSDIYRQVENVDPYLQTKGAEEIAREEWKEYYDGGKWATKRIQNKKTIEQIPNIPVRNELLALIKGDEEYYRANGANSEAKKQVDDAIALIKTSSPQKGKVINKITGAAIPDNTKFLARHLADERRMFHLAARKEFPNNPTVAYANAEAKFKEWYEGKGLNVVAQPNSKDEKIGIFSPDIHGNYALYEQWRDNITRADTERIKIGNEHNMLNWVGKADRIAINAQEQNVTPTEYIAQGNNVITKEDALATVMDLNAGRSKTLHPTPEVVTVARWLQIPPAKLLALTIENVIDQDPEYAKLHNFPTLLKKIQPMVDTEEEIKELLKQSDSQIGTLYKSNLLFTWNHGLENAQPWQLQELLEELAKKADIKYHTNTGSGRDGSFGAGTHGEGRPSDSQLKI